MKNTSLTQRQTTPTEPNWQPLNDFAEQKQNDSGLKAWLAVVEGCIRAIEKPPGRAGKSPIRPSKPGRRWAGAPTL